MIKCPKCGIVMNEVLKLNIKIDVCPQCMGIWTDNGELEKIIENSLGSENMYDNRDAHYNRKEHYDDDDHEERGHFDKGNYEKGHYNKRKGGIRGMFGDLFD